MNRQEENELKNGPLWRRDGEKKGAKFKEFHATVFGNTLYWFKSAKDCKPENRKKSTGSLVLVGCTITELSGETMQNAISIVQPNKKIEVFAANDYNSAKDWIAAMKSSATGGKENKETIAIQEELRKVGHEIAAEDLEFDDDVIGTGASGVVKRGMWLKSTEVAVKALKNLPEFTDQKELLGFYQEIETLSKLRHVNVVQMYGFAKKQNYLCLVTEFVRGGNLASALDNPNEYPLDGWLQMELAFSICRGMVYLHNQNVIHRDLKPANVLIESWLEGKVKVCDFGLSKVGKKQTGIKKSNEEEPENALGSPQYAAPELNSNPDHTNKVDVFSYGLILWEIMAKKSPWPEVKFGWEFAERYSSGQRPNMLPEWPSPLKVLIANCWDKDPNVRKSFVQIYSSLEECKKEPSFQVRSQLRTGSSSNNLQGNMSVEDIISQTFGTKQSESWARFSQALANAMKSNPEQIKQIEYLFSENGVVKRKTWEDFLSWFSPLSAVGTYNPNDNNSGGYTMQHIVDVCTPIYFHGFLGANEAQDALKNKNKGTFLVRFSTSNPGFYALSVAYSNSVGHWRISCSKEVGKNPIYKIDGRAYTSLQDIVNTHKLGSEALKIKQAKPGELSEVNLITPAPRKGANLGNSLYQNI